MPVKLLMPSSYWGFIDSKGFLLPNDAGEAYLSYLLSCDGFLGFETQDELPVGLPHKTEVGVKLFVYKFTKVPYFIVFDTEDNALLYKLGLPDYV